MYVGMGISYGLSNETISNKIYEEVTIPVKIELPLNKGGPISVLWLKLLLVVSGDPPPFIISPEHRKNSVFEES